MPSPFSKLFGRSPFSSLQEHMKEVVSCVNLMADTFTALEAGDRELLQKVADLVNERENRADEIKVELRKHLPKSLFLPVDRRDVLHILESQDNIADRAQDIPEMLLLRDFPFPPSLAEKVHDLVASSLAVVHRTSDVIHEMDELVETGFGGREREMVENMLIEISELENVSDLKGLDCCRLLFSLEDEIGPVSVVLWFDIIRWIGDIADHAEKVSNLIRLLLAR